MTACILIVDDFPSNVKLLEAKLEKEYYNTLSALNGKEALKIAKELQPDIILLDVMMPGMDGFEVCELLKSDFITESIPVIFITALDDIESRVRGLNYGAEDFLSKPINDTALFARIKSLVRLKMFSDELHIRNKVSIYFNHNLLGIKCSAQDLSQANIIIIDDDKVQAQQVCSYLEDEFNGVVVSDSNVQDFCINLDKQVDLLIVNMQSEQYDGLKVSSILRSKHNMKNIPILMLIDENDTSYLIKGMEIGINDYLTIPINKQELIARSRLQIKKKRYHDALYNNMMNSMEMAIIDPLTRCYNRSYLERHLEQKMVEVRKNNVHQLALLVFDIDFFKQVNDSFGHLGGDHILRELTQLVHTNIRASDLLARFGGEEFVVLLPNSDSEYDTMQVAEKLVKLIASSKFVINGKEHRVTISIGATHLKASDDMHSFIKRADDNLYQAKKCGRNQLVFK